MKKGFTLAETIGVIVVLGFIAIITVPFIDDYLKNSKNKALETNCLKILEAAKSWNMKYGSENECDTATGCVLYIEDKTDDIPDEENRVLKESEFLSNEDIINPKTKEEITGTIAIKKNDEIYSYTFNGGNACAPYNE